MEGKWQRRLVSLKTSDLNEWIIKFIEGKRSKIIASLGYFVWP
jgi:hypothetical protein